MRADTLAQQATAQTVDRAAKLAFHAKRLSISTLDVRTVLGERGCLSGDAQLSKVVAGDLLCWFEMEIGVGQGRALHPTPLEVGISQHWLAVAGCQPTSLENAQPKRTSAISNDLPGVSRQAPRRASPPAGLQGITGNSGARQPTHDAAGTGDGAVHIYASLPLKHSLPGELHLYFNMVRRALQQPYGGADGLQAQAVCATLATDPGLQPLLPYLVPMLADEVGRRLVHAGHLQLMLRCVHDAGSLVGLMAFGVPVLLHAVVPSVKRYSHLFHGTNGCSRANLELRAALMTVLGRCMAWQHGAYADVVWRAVSDAGLVQAVGAIAPAPEVHL
ncbi:Transcription initiation factor TFIID subunit 6 [Chlorella vulgaris]